MSFDEANGAFETRKVYQKKTTETQAAGSGRGEGNTPGILPKWITLTGSFSAKKDKSRTHTIEGSREDRQVYPVGNDAVFISPNSDETPLRGPVVSNTTFGRFRPNTALDSCLVAAEILVTEDWVDYLDPKPVDLRPDLHARWSRNRSHRSNRSVNFQRDAFRLLLSHLVNKGLQRDPDSPYATFAMDALLLLPTDIDGELGMSVAHLETSREKDTKPISFKKLLEVTQQSPRNTIEALRSEGVPDERVLGLTQKYELSPEGLGADWKYIDSDGDELAEAPEGFGIAAKVLHMWKIYLPDGSMLDIAGRLAGIQNGVIVAYSASGNRATVLKIYKNHALTKHGHLQSQKELKEEIYELTEFLFASRDEKILPFSVWVQSIEAFYLGPKPFFPELLDMDRQAIQRLCQEHKLEVIQSRDGDELLVSRLVPKGASVSSHELKEAAYQLLQGGKESLPYTNMAQDLSRSLGFVAGSKREIGVAGSWRTLFESDDRFETDQHGIRLKS
ncbi:hypothetical protein GCM10007385_24500 [Tateyamaria omphalii]|nr:hypothetical protein GCM10007385_24500 [Tateyamaria omphalii]